MTQTNTTCSIACVQMNTSNDLKANVTQASELIEQAAEQKANFIALPENAFMMRASDSEHTTLYPVEEHPGIMMCQHMAKKYQSWILIGSVFAPCIPIAGQKPENEKWYNRSVLIDDQGNIVTTYDKIHLFDANINPNKTYRESARIVPGTQVRVIDTPWGRLGMTICYDVRFPHMYRDLAKAGAIMLAIPAAFALHTGQAHWHVLLRARAIETGSFVIAPGQCGTHPGNKKTYGHSLIINPWGEILAEASHETPEIITATIDLSEVETIRGRLPCLEHDRNYLSAQDFVI